jgi:hypothetical protein
VHEIHRQKSDWKSMQMKYDDNEHQNDQGKGQGSANAKAHSPRRFKKEWVSYMQDDIEMINLFTNGPRFERKGQRNVEHEERSKERETAHVVRGVGGTGWAQVRERQEKSTTDVHICKRRPKVISLSIRSNPVPYNITGKTNMRLKTLRAQMMAHLWYR